jgi:hypothetical protein
VTDDPDNFETSKSTTRINKPRQIISAQMTKPALRGPPRHSVTRANPIPTAGFPGH